MGIEEIFEAILGGVEKERRQRRESPAPTQRPVRRRPLPHLESVPRTGDGGIGDVMRSVVQIVALREGFLGGMSSAWTGSGTIVHPQGLILTNCHVANPRAMGMSSPPADRLGIAITDRSDEPPAVSYFAEVVAQDPKLDLAVVRIYADVSGRRIRGLDLPAVALGDSGKLELGDQLSIFGYPGIGGETVTFTSGNVSGFSREKGVNEMRAWIKTDATISGGNSGGTAVDDDGKLVGIPTQAAAGTGVTPVDARPVLDTNRDGRVDQRDTPMAIGGFINGLRPINLAIPLLEEAGMRVDRQHSHRDQEIAPPATRPPQRYERRRRSQPEFSELLFSLRVTEDSRPIHPTTRIPSGVDEVFASFEYDEMDPGTPWSVVWMSQGKIIIEKEDRWDDEREGRKTVKISNRKGLPDGEYHLVLGIGGKVALEGKMMVGTPTDETDAEVSGMMVDADSDRPVRDGLVIVLKPNAEMREFLRTRDRDLIFSSAETGHDGSFTFKDQLPKGYSYSLVAVAPGYEPVTVEGALRVGETAPEHANIGSIPMERI